ncbi:MAG: type II secretion system F family protein [Planctomycetota bacterium]|nr:type II secretion system F family protein [Planctomycetota bacterium]
MTILISIAAFFGVACLVGGIAMLMRGRGEEVVENRLAQLTGAKVSSKDGLLNRGVLYEPLGATKGLAADFVARFQNLTLLFEQADTSLTPGKFVAISAGLGVAGALVSVVAGVTATLVVPLALLITTLPLMWLILRRRMRLKKFAKQLPDALELIARALRAGHSLASGFRLVADEMTDPIGAEFNRVFEEQNLGIAMEDALNNMTERVPNLDLKFFVTSVVLQRQTGGDLAEILDKIGELVRERFKIWGQVQALTGEGRLSGIVLLALPPALFLAVYRLNPDYVMILFTDPMGKQMLAGGVIMQILGALVIRKIVNIRV